jgi:hypothetical protein
VLALISSLLPSPHSTGHEGKDFLITPAGSLFAPLRLCAENKSGKKGRAFLDTLEKEHVQVKKGTSRCSAPFNRGDKFNM